MKRKKKDWKKASLQSTLVLQSLRAVRDLVAALAAQGDTAAASLEACLAPVLAEGEEMPDLRLLVRLLERLAARAGAVRGWAQSRNPRLLRLARRFPRASNL